MKIRKRTASCFVLLVMGATGCIPPADRFSTNSTQAPDTLRPSNTTQATEFAEAPPRQEQRIPPGGTRKIGARVRDLQLKIEEEKAELRLMEQALAELKQLQQAQRAITPPQVARQPEGHAPPANAPAKAPVVPRVFPPLLPEPALPAEQLIEAKLDDIDRILAKLRSAKHVEQANDLERRVIEARSRLRDVDATFEPLGGRELHVVGLYEGEKFELGRQRAEVHVTYTEAPIVLCLTSYEKIHWTIRADKGAKLESIVLGGRLQFLVEPPAGVTIIDCTAENAGTQPLTSAYSRYSTDSSGSRFPMLAKQLQDITGLAVTTFQGGYRYPGTPIVVGPQSEAWRQERVLAELRRIHREATYPERLQQWHQMKDLWFTAVHYRFAGGNRRHPMQPNGVSASIGPFTPLGPDLDKHTPFPVVNCPVHDPTDGNYYAVGRSGLIQVNQRGGKHVELQPPKDLPEVSWPCGLALDTKRGRVVLVTMGGAGYMYGYEPAKRTWTLIADLHDADLNPFIYLPDQDQFLGLGVDQDGANYLYWYDFNGDLLKKTKLSRRLRKYGANHSNCQAAVAGSYVILLMGAEQTTPEGNPTTRALAIDPATGEIVFSMLHDDETLRAAAQADLAEAPDWTKAAVLASPPAGNRPKAESVAPLRSAEAVLADLRELGSKGFKEAPELHVIGFYEPGHRFHHSPGQPASVDIRIKPSSKPIVVALTAYESTRWQVTLEPGANVAAIILSGYHSHTAEGVPSDVPLINMSYDDGSRNYFYGYDKTRPDYDAMLKKARKVTGLEVLTFQGSYTPLPDTTYRIRPAVPGDYKAVRERIDEQQRTDATSSRRE